MISKIKEQVSVINSIIDSVEENGGFSHLDKNAALDSLRYIYDSIVVAPVKSYDLNETSAPDVEVSIYGKDEDDNLEIEFEKFEDSHLNDDCEFIIENKAEDENEEDVEEDENEDITVEELFFDSEGNIVESKMEIDLSESEPDEDLSEIEAESEDKTEEEVEIEEVEEEVEDEEDSQKDVKFVIGEIIDDETCDGNLSLENEDVMAVLSEEQIVYASDNELLYEDNDLFFSEGEKDIILNGMFKGNASEYDDFVIEISKFTDFDEAIIYLQENYANCDCEKSLEIVAEKLTEKLI